MREHFPSVIKAKSDSVDAYQARTDWAIITGLKEYPKPTFYQHTETGEKYYHLAGALGWPWENIPGYALVIGVIKTDNGKCRMRILEETEDTNVPRLLLKCVGLREKYGYWEDPNLMRYFYGNDQRYTPITLAVCVELREKDGNSDEHGFWIYTPDNFDEKDHFETYMRQVQTALTPDTTGEKMLLLGGNERIKSHIQTLSNATVKQLEYQRTAKEYPAVFALGALVHTLLQRRPWMMGTGAEVFNLEDF